MGSEGRVHARRMGAAGSLEEQGGSPFLGCWQLLQTPALRDLAAAML